MRQIVRQPADVVWNRLNVTTSQVSGKWARSTEAPNGLNRGLEPTERHMRSSADPLQVDHMYLAFTVPELLVRLSPVDLLLPARTP